MQCPFCEELSTSNDNWYFRSFAKKVGVPSRIVMETDHWCAFPTVGCFTPGYVLLVCKEHYRSMANLPEYLFLEMLQLKASVERKLYQSLNLSCLAFEHGTPNTTSIGANSIDHVHIHLVPYGTPIWTELNAESQLGDFEIVSSYLSLYNQMKTRIPDTYLFFQDVDSKIYYKEQVIHAPSQFFRRGLATILNVSEWDWKKESYIEHIKATLTLF